FDYNYRNLSESALKLLKLWPTDDQISQTIKHSHQLVCELAEFLNIIQPIDDFFKSNFPQVFVVIHEEEVSTNIENETISSTNNNKQNEENEINISMAITEASCKMKHITTQEYNEEILSNNLFQEGSLQLNIVNRSNEDFSILYNGDRFQYRLENNLDFELLLQQRQRHEAYTSRSLEQKLNIKSVSTKFNINTTMTIHLNKASHIVAYFSKNENPEEKSVKQREKR
ncbi:20162_t:CDS:2, partial [Racocetra fulgida]